MPKLLRKAAQYVRMSTDMQQYSTLNQQALIAQYADNHGIEIIKTYVDEGRSGLRLAGRDALQSLLAVVTSGEAEYEVILVYDVSRWGRFKILMRALITSLSVAEQENPSSTVQSSLQITALPWLVSSKA